MIKLNKYEALGIASAVVMMSLALFFIRVGDTFNISGNSNVGEQSASVIMFDDSSEGAEALDGAMTGGRVTKLVATDVVIGEGEEVEKGSEVTIHYIATLQNGQEFDNTKKKGEAFSFKVGDNKIIAGLNQGVVGMKEGGQRVIVIPANLAYGSEGYGPVPKNAAVVYAVEMIALR